MLPDTELESVRAMIAATFSGSRWPHPGPPEEINPENARDIARELFLFSDETKKYELPKLMSLAIASGNAGASKELIRTLLEFLDVEFDDPEGTNDELKKAKRRIFCDYSPSEAKVILSWLRFVQKRSATLGGLHDLSPDSLDHLECALRYWQNRAAA